MSPAAALEVLVVDDDANVRRAVRGVLEDDGCRVTEAGDAEAALGMLEGGAFRSVVLDLGLPGMHGLDALERIREKSPETGVVILTGEGTTESVVRAIRAGAYDFLEKPLDSPERNEHLVVAVRQSAQVTRIREKVPERRGVPPARPGEAVDPTRLGLLGESAAMRALRETIARVAPSQGRVLIRGENGSGKELVAAAIHAMSKRADGPLVRLNCAAIPRELVESELFGHEKGSFTGALQSRQGRFEQADGGTLFLDEIGELSSEAQAKLLRAIETGEVERVGGNQPLRCDVRVISATHRDLSGAIEAGSFREDLYFRLNVLPVLVPALRERPGDIPFLADHFLRGVCEAEGRSPRRLSPEAIELLQGYAWPGNVRELRNLMERVVVLVDHERVGPEDLLLWLEPARGGEDSVGLRGEIERREADAVRKALEAAGGNVTQAAAALGIDRTNLHRKMRKYGIQRR
jgi:DNA-binding NtrC family response regulator